MSPHTDAGALLKLAEWKDAVLGCCKACDGFDALQWGGDKDGWGFVMFFIGHLSTRAIEAEAALRQAASHGSSGGGPLTLAGMIAAIYEGLDAEDCAMVDRQWAKQRGYIVKADGTSTLSRTPDAAQAPSKEETFCHWLKGYLGAIKGRDELDAREANVVRNKLNEMLDGTSPVPSAEGKIHD